MGNKKLWGLIGNSKIGEYSLAPKMWEDLFKKKNILVKYFILGGDRSSEISLELKTYLKDPDFIGANIALPWKYLGYEFCDYVENSASHMDAINTILNKNSRIEGHNTDGIGIINVILKNENINGKTILLLGCGSSSQTVPYHLIRNGAEKIYVTDLIESRAKRLSRKYSHQGEKSGVEIIPLNQKELQEIISKIDILINTTPCGMNDYKQKYPLSKENIDKLNKNCLLVEAVYTPYETPLLVRAKQNGNRVCPGINMLVEQAAESFNLAFGEKLTEEEKKFMGDSAKNALEEKKKTILITGASGFIGEYLVNNFKNKYNVIGIDIIDNKKNSINNFYVGNICDNKLLDKIFQEEEIDYVIHSAAAKHLIWCEENKETANKSNFLATKAIYERSKRSRAKFIFISSDQVFDGKGGDYSESFPKNPINNYGKLKSLCEDFLIKDPKVAICRTAMVFGKIPENQITLFNKIKEKDSLIIQGYIVNHVLHKLKNKEKVVLPKDEFCNPTSNSLLFKQLKLIIRKDLGGIFHCCGGEKISRYEFGRKIANLFNLDEKFIDSGSSNDPLRPKDVSMRFKKSEKSMGFKFPKINEMVSEEWNLI